MLTKFNQINSIKKYSNYIHFQKCLISNQRLQKIVVIGAGLMGSGIAQVSASSGYQVVLADQNSEALKKGQGIIQGSLARVAKKLFKEDIEKQKQYIEEVTGRYQVTQELDNCLKDADMVVEAIIEDLSIKQKLFQKLEQQVSNKTILCSNTSSLPLSAIAKDLKDKTRFAGLHFFNPVPQMKLVEVIKHEETKSSIVEDLFQYCKTLDKVPIQCKDTPGFIVNRLLVPYMLEAIRLYERGDASKEDIDIGMKLGAGYPMGPFELMDYVGLDTLQFITKQWYEQNPHLKGESLILPSKTVEELVKKGHIGRKSGKGFYDYSS